MKKHSCSSCGSLDYYCKGFCKSCYRKQHTNIVWSKISTFCVSCGQSSSPHVARGLCSKCYGKQNTSVLCECGCGLPVSIRGTKAKRFCKGHWAKTDGSREIFKSDMTGSNNPQWGKFGKNHPAFGHTTSDLVRDLRRKTRLEYMSSRNSNPTSIEITLSNLLDSMSINHIPQHVMYGKFTVDEFLPDYGMIIEACGGYWHGDVRRFSNLSKLQKSNVLRDSSRYAYLTKCGHSILLLWEIELVGDVDWCRSEILHALSRENGLPFIQDSVHTKS